MLDSTQRREMVSEKPPWRVSMDAGGPTECKEELVGESYSEW